MADFPLPVSTGQLKRIAGVNQAANTEVSDTVPVAANEVQSISGTPSATFGLTFDGISGPISLATNATAQSIQDYINAFQAFGPNGVVCTGGALPSAVTVTYSGPIAAGRNISQPTVAGGATGITISTTTQGSNLKWWYLLSVSVQCAQGATQTPWPSLIIDDGTNTIFQAFCGTAAISSATTTQCTWAPNLPALGSAASTANTGPLPQGLVLPGGYRIRTSTTGIGANTDYGAPSYFVCELGD